MSAFLCLSIHSSISPSIHLSAYTAFYLNGCPQYFFHRNSQALTQGKLSHQVLNKVPKTLKKATQDCACPSQPDAGVAGASSAQGLGAPEERA